MWWIPIILVAVVLLVLFWCIATANRFRQTLVKINEALSGIDVALTKRFDVLSKMLEATKAFAKHEKETFAQLVQLRKGMPMPEKIAANRQMDEVQGRINVLAEAYPQLRSSENFQRLQHSVSDVEEHIQAARRVYNANVSVFNQLLVTFPASLIGSNMKLERQEFFQADSAKRADVPMSF